MVNFLPANNARVVCVIPTYNGKLDLLRLAQSFSIQTLSTDIIVIDSGSTDGTCDVAKSFASCVEVILPKDFNHGATRQMIINKFPDYDFYIYLTQDAELENPFALEKIVAYFSDPSVGAVCGRQIPHLDADFFAYHARTFNYPDSTSIRSIADSQKLGLKTIFLSNSFAAYRRFAIQSIGGFPNDVIFGEDMYVAGKMILSGWKVAYSADAIC